VFESKIFVCEFLDAVDCAGAGAVAVYEVAALDHEAFDLSCISTLTCFPSPLPLYSLASKSHGFASLDGLTTR